MRTPLAALAALALLAGCGETPDEAPPPPAPLPDASPIPVEPDGGIGDGAEPLPETQAAADAMGSARIPARFQGVWDYEGGTCARESDMRMEISGGEVLFYESIGMVTDVAAEAEDVVITLAMEGEGETWIQKTRLSLVGEGEELRLHTSDGEAPKQIDEYPSKSCPQ